jgi:hypothetical protein
VIIAAVGVFVVQGALTFGPGKAKGLERSASFRSSMPSALYLVATAVASLTAAGTCPRGSSPFLVL